MINIEIFFLQKSIRGLHEGKKISRFIFLLPFDGKSYTRKCIFLNYSVQKCTY